MAQTEPIKLETKTPVKSLDITDEHNDTYKISVGGKIFTSKKDTFEKSEYLKALFKFPDDNKQKTDFTDHPIDRDSTIFKYLLNIMRDINYIDKKVFKYGPDISFFQITFLLEYMEKNKSTDDKVKITKINSLSRVDVSEEKIYLYAYVPDPGHYTLRFTCVYMLLTGIDLEISEGYVGLLSLANELSSCNLINTILYPGIYKNLYIKIFKTSSSDYGMHYIMHGSLIAQLIIIKCINQTKLVKEIVKTI